MFLHIAVMGIGMSEMLVILALGILAYGARTLAEAPHYFAAVVLNVHRELNSTDENAEKQAGDVKTQDR